MTEEDKKRNYLADLLKLGYGYTDRQSLAAFLLAYGVDVTLPPEPQWKPVQHARVVLDGSWVLGERHPANTGWLIPGDNGLFHDDEVTDIEPVVVLTTDEVRELRKNRGISNFERFFRERGLDL